MSTAEFGHLIPSLLQKISVIHYPPRVIRGVVLISPISYFSGDLLESEYV